MRVLDKSRALFATVGLGAVLAVSSWVPHDAIPPSIVLRPAAGASGGGEFSISMIETGAEQGVPKLHEQRAVAEFIAGRYRIADEAVAPVVEAAYRVGEESSMDPLLILAVIAIESSFDPAAESALGAKGLMQIMAKFHMKEIASHGGQDVLLDPNANIRVGTQILREYLRRFGEIETALQMYAGAVNDPNWGYARKVLAERSRIEQTVIRLRHAA
jgi:soluble lytic murein transglycosylase-like protein